MLFFFFFFFNDTATTEISPLPLHDALPICGGEPAGALADAIKKTFGDFTKFKEQIAGAAISRFGSGWAWLTVARSEEHTSELQSRSDLVCRLLLEKKKKKKQQTSKMLMT